MIICGIKFTHDGGLALIDNNKLKFSVEIEKIANNPRYSGINHTNSIKEVLETNGYSLDQVDRFVLDGWHGTEDNWRKKPMISTKSESGPIKLPVAGYHEQRLDDDILERLDFESGLEIDGKQYGYSSYKHVSGHILGTYCTSPFSKRGENSYVLVWDGGQYPRLYYIDFKEKKITNKGHLFFFLGTIYSIIGQYFGPYKKTKEELQKDRELMELEGFFGGYSIAGKIMSYIGKGVIQPELLENLPKIYNREFEISNMFEHKVCAAIRDEVEGKEYTDADVLLTVHTYLQQLLIDGLKKKIAKDDFEKSNFCFCGGSALNIKWNSAIRRTEIFKEIYVPPFPNDSGSAIGTAACEMWLHSDNIGLDWTVYSGPEIIKNGPVEGWKQEECSVKSLAELMHAKGEPVVALNGRAAVGPRALGHRSILSPPGSKNMKKVLNGVKNREAFRPVAPICLEASASDIFEPGTNDPFMLFDHQVTDEWKNKIPAICHLDGSARLQTVSKNEPFIFELLTEYYKVSGIPVLCNTSANFNGSGFFPDVKSTCEWEGVNYVWCEGVLFSKEEKIIFDL